MMTPGSRASSVPLAVRRALLSRPVNVVSPAAPPPTKRPKAGPAAGDWSPSKGLSGIGSRMGCGDIGSWREADGEGPANRIVLRAAVRF